MSMILHIKSKYNHLQQLNFLELITDLLLDVRITYLQNVTYFANKIEIPIICFFPTACLNYNLLMYETLKHLL